MSKKKKQNVQEQKGQKKNKRAKIIAWTIIGILITGACIGIGVWLYYEIKAEDNKSKEETSIKTPLVYNFEGANPEHIGARSTMFNVGQNDSSLVQIKKDDNGYIENNNENFDILIDAGSDDVNKMPQRIIDKGVKTIDLIVITHAHSDHLNAFKKIAQNKKTNLVNEKTLVLCNFQEYLNEKVTKTAKEALSALKEAKAQFVDAKVIANNENNKLVDFGSYGYFSVLGPYIDGDNTNPNSWSIVNRFEFNNVSTLYTGDLAGKLDKSTKIAKTINPKWINQLDCDYLKSPHHGSATEDSNGMDFIKQVSPEEVWISAGHTDKYHLPSHKALDNYIKSGILPENIKGTEYFGPLPGHSDDKWKELENWIQQYPTINNNNQGYNDIIQIYK